MCKHARIIAVHHRRGKGNEVLKDPGPTPDSPSPGISSELADHEKRIGSIESSMAPQTFKDFPLPWNTWKDVAASYQTVYSSIQGFKLDLEAVSVTTDGISVFGAQIMKSPLAGLFDMPVGSLWEKLLEKSDGNAAASRIVRLVAPDSTVQDFNLKAYKAETALRLSGHEVELGKHSNAISQIARGQAHLAEVARVSSAGQAHEAARRTTDNRLTQANREGYRRTSEDLTRLGTELERIKERADSLATAIGTA